MTDLIHAGSIHAGLFAESTHVAADVPSAGLPAVLARPHPQRPSRVALAAQEFPSLTQYDADADAPRWSARRALALIVGVSLLFWTLIFAFVAQV